MDLDYIIDSLSPIERAIVPYLGLSVEEIIEKSGSDKTTVLRALSFLENKGLVKLKHERKNIVCLGVNGVYYKKTGLPERKLLTIIEQNNYKKLDEIKSLSKLSDNEFKASLGALKRKAIINLVEGKISIAGRKEELSKRFPEEVLLDKLPVPLENIKEMDALALENLKTRKEIIEITEEKTTLIELTENGKKIAGKKVDSNLMEEVTTETISNPPKNLKFRHYEVNAPVPKIYGGKKHFVNQSIEYAKQVWKDMGFKEMTGNIVQTSFWNFDSLFTPQDHPAREMQDTYFIKGC